MRRDEEEVREGRREEGGMREDPRVMMLLSILLVVGPCAKPRCRGEEARGKARCKVMKVAKSTISGI